MFRRVSLHSFPLSFFTILIILSLIDGIDFDENGDRQPTHTRVLSSHVMALFLLASVYWKPSTWPVLRPNRPCRFGPTLLPSPSCRLWHCAQRVLKRPAPFLVSPVLRCQLRVLATRLSSFAEVVVVLDANGDVSVTWCLRRRWPLPSGPRDVAARCTGDASIEQVRAEAQSVDTALERPKLEARHAMAHAGSASDGHGKLPDKRKRWQNIPSEKDSPLPMLTD